MISQSIEKCSSALEEGLYNNILLIGGNTKYPNFKARLEIELLKQWPENIS